MKLLIAVFSLSLTAAQSEANVVVPLKCASKKNENLYFTEGQLLFTAKHVLNETTLLSTSLTLVPRDKLSADERQADGKISRDGKWVRFVIGGDAWCSYRIALPRDFQNRRDSIPAFVDAFCEENSYYSIRLNCRIN